MTSAATKAALDLAMLEAEARTKAQAQVAFQLQRPDQLEKVEQIRKRISRKKSSVEVMLKTAVQSQLDGVRTGLNQLQNALRDIQEIKQSLDEMESTYQSISGLGDKLKKVREENSRHSQLAAAVENLKHIFNVPETQKRCEDLINDGKLLHAHKCLTDLEGSRDDLLFELHKQATQSPTDKNTVKHYFSAVEKLSESLGKQMWVILQRTLMTARREPTMIVTVMRIIEREERTDAVMLKRYDQTGYIPPGRPKRWRQRAFQVLEEAVIARIEGSQLEDRSINNMWLVRHLENTRQIVIEDLRVIKTLCEDCFPPHYHIVNKYVEMYHNGIAQHLKDVFMQGLEGNEVISFLTWVNDYNSVDMMEHPDLNIDTSELSPLLEPSVIMELENQYLQTTGKNFQEWIGNSLKSDVKDWHKEEKPDADAQGYFVTHLPVILFQMIEQTLAVAQTISQRLVAQVVTLFLNELDTFTRTYKQELVYYKEIHVQDRSQPPCFLEYMMANINNCETFPDLIQKIHDQFIEDPEHAVSPERLKFIKGKFSALAAEICDEIMEEMLMDLDAFLQELITKKWLQSSNAADTICVTVEDYSRDLVHTRQQFYNLLICKLQSRVAVEYYKALFTRRMSFKNYEDRLMAGGKMEREADQLATLFRRLIGSEAESPFDPMPAIAEMIKMKDTSMMSLEISGFVNNYPDIRTDQMIGLLLVRGDMGRSEARQIVIDCLGEDHDIKHKSKKTIFSNQNL